jgi:hypothetical protein
MLDNGARRAALIGSRPAIRNVLTFYRADSDGQEQ